MLSDKQDTYEQIPYDELELVGKEEGDYGTTEYVYLGQLGQYRLRIGQSITDKGKVLYFFQNGRMFLTLYPTRTKKVFVGKDEDGEYVLFRFDGKSVKVFKRKYDI